MSASRPTLDRRFVDVLAWYRDRGVPWIVLAEGLGVRKQTAHRAWAAAVTQRLAAGAPTSPAEQADPELELALTP